MKLRLVIAAFLIFGLASTAQASLVLINDTPAAGEQSLYWVYNQLYGTTIANSADLMTHENDAATDFGMYSSTSGKVWLVARYSAAPATLNMYNGGDQLIGNFAPDSDYYGYDATKSYDVINPYHFGLRANVSYNGSYDWYSEKSKNNPNDGLYHFVVLNTPDPNKFLVGFEDLTTASNSDFDYQDAVFEMENIAPTNTTPEPATLLLFGIGSLAAGFMRRKKA